MTWGGWIKGRRAAVEMGLPYIRVQGAENHPFVQAADDFLESQVSKTNIDIIIRLGYHKTICNSINYYLFLSNKICFGIGCNRRGLDI